MSKERKAVEVAGVGSGIPGVSKDAVGEGVRVAPEWWRTLFDEVYLLTDARSVGDPLVTSKEVDRLLEELQLVPGEVILDLCGGHGRHALELGRRGFSRLTVLDYSQYLLQVGREQARRENLPVSFIKGDARWLPVAGGTLHTVLILANSFGYGQDRWEDEQILRECWRVLTAGGRLFLELPDPGYLRSHLQRCSWHEADADVIVCRERWLSERVLTCREVVLSRSRGLIREAAYRIRLYEADEITSCLHRCGFSRVRVRDGGSPYSRPADYGSLSRRLMVTAWK